MFARITYALCALIFLCTTPTFAQNNSLYYWSAGQQISINTDYSSLVLQFKDGYAVEKHLKLDDTRLKDYEIHKIQGRAILRLNAVQQKEALDLAKTFVSDATALRSASFAYQLEDGFQIWPTHHVVLQLNSGVTISDLRPALAASKASFAREKYGRVLLEVSDINQVLPLANQLRESGLAKWAHPDFYAKIQHTFTPSDTYYGDQFQMNNSNDVDCDAPAAWDITRGSSNIRVAVIDDGLEAHPDLPNLNLALGYSPANNGNGTPNSSGEHGVACAGVINAAHNGFGVAGIAPNVEIFSVNIFIGGETGNDLADAISYAVNNGADVLSNSWGYGNCSYSISALNTALADAKYNGRNGNGAVIVFAAGNEFMSCVSYPGNNDNVIAVGAITNTGVRSSYSNQGPKLDISAPSSGGTKGVYTTDRVGYSGYDNGSYTSTFGGTSAACPLVAGVAALVLSANSNLSSVDVQDILESTATDMGSAGFDVEFGHGRVDADDAINAALGSDGGGSGDCVSGNLTLTLVTDRYASETSWRIIDENGLTVESGSGYGNSTTNTININLADGDYTFIIRDSYGDGICCTNGNGSYTLVDENGVTVASGGEFTNTDETTFCTETEDNNGGGSGDCVSGNLTLTLVTDRYASETSWRIVDASGVTVTSGSGYGSSTTNNISITLTNGDYTFIIDDSFKDGICCTNGNGSYTLVDENGVTVASGGEFTDTEETTFCVGADGGNGGGNGNCADGGLVLTLVTDRYASETSWRIVDANGVTVRSGSGYASSTTNNINIILTNGDYTFIIDDSSNDGICCSYGSGSYALVDANGVTVASGGEFTDTEETPFCVGSSNTYAHGVSNHEDDSRVIDALAVQVFPNPTKDVLNIQLGGTDVVQARITDALGRVVREQRMQAGINQLNIADFSAGMYQLTIINKNGETTTKKFTKVQ